MNEVFYSSGEEPRGDSMNELRHAIDEIVDTTAADSVPPQLVEQFNAAAAHVAEEYDMTGDEVAQVVRTIWREES